MLDRIHLQYTPAVIVSVIGAVLAVLVSFGLHLTQQNIDSVLTLVGLIAAGITIGGGVKSGASLAAGVHDKGLGTSFHYTPAVVVSIVGALLTIAVAFGFHLTQDDIQSILKLVGLIAGGTVVGGAVKSGGMLRAGVHPLQTHAAEGPIPRQR